MCLHVFVCRQSSAFQYVKILHYINILTRKERIENMISMFVLLLGLGQ